MFEAKLGDICNKIIQDVEEVKNIKGNERAKLPINPVSCRRM